MQRKKDSKPVYSTQHGRLCPGCGYATAHCVCKTGTVQGSGDGVVRLRRESKGRGGKTVTIVEGLPGDEQSLKTMAKRLKQQCGVGGALKARNIEIQGDHRERIAGLLRDQGYQVKLAGG